MNADLNPPHKQIFAHTFSLITVNFSFFVRKSKSFEFVKYGSPSDTIPIYEISPICEIFDISIKLYMNSTFIAL